MKSPAKRRSRQPQSPQPEGKIVTCAQAAEALRAFDQKLTPEDRAQIAAGIEYARRRMNNEHLH